MPKPGSDGSLTPQLLRELYITGTLKQRYRIACQRIDFPGLGPSLLVNAVSALEGFSRAVAMNALIETGTPAKEAYAFLRNTGTVELITKHICPSLQLTPQKAFGKTAWARIPDAVSWRNLLIHDATYLDGGTCTRLIAACRHCLDRLAALTDAT